MNINFKVPQTSIPQSVGSEEKLINKKYQVDTLNSAKLIVLREN